MHSLCLFLVLRCDRFCDCNAPATIKFIHGFLFAWRVLVTGWLTVLWTSEQLFCSKRRLTSMYFTGVNIVDFLVICVGKPPVSVVQRKFRDMRRPWSSRASISQISSGPSSSIILTPWALLVVRTRCNDAISMIEHAKTDETWNTSRSSTLGL